MSSRRIPFFCLIAALGMGAFFLGCDQVSRPAAKQRPSVSGLEIVPDSVDAAQLSPGQVKDSVARVPLRIGVNATDPDGTVDRVVYTIEPSSNPRGTLSGTLSPVEDNRYRRELGLGIPVSFDEVYTIRVFAVDDDSLASNQGVGRFRFVAK